MGIWRTRIPETSSICESDSFGRILKYDQTGRIFLLPSFRRRMEVRQVSVLSQLRVGESGVVVALDLPDSVQNHLMHMGFVPEALVTALRRAPAGDPTVYGVDGMEIALRHETAEAIRVHSPEAKAADAAMAAERPEIAGNLESDEIDTLVEAAR